FLRDGTLSLQSTGNFWLAFMVAPLVGFTLGSVDKTRQNSLPSGGFAKKFLARAIMWRPIDRGVLVIEPETPVGWRELWFRKSVPGSTRKQRERAADE